MKVPTYHKFGLTKAQIHKSEARDQKISDILTHKLTLGIGVVFGLVIYVIYYSKVQPESFIQIVGQVFLFASMGIICVGIPAVLFKLCEMLYFKYKARGTEHKTITKYKEERDEFDFWKLRKDFSFWKFLDGLSFEKEIINVYMHMGYDVNEEFYSNENPYDRILSKDGKSYYFSFNTKPAENTDIETIDKLQRFARDNTCDGLLVFSQNGFQKKVLEYSADKNAGLLDINGIIKVVRTIKNPSKAEINTEEN
jgi:hypothetical protein